MDRIQELRWTHRSLPEHVKANLSPLEAQYFRQYDKLLNRYMRSGQGVGLDLTADPAPPDDPYVQVGVRLCVRGRGWVWMWVRGSTQARAEGARAGVRRGRARLG